MENHITTKPTIRSEEFRVMLENCGEWLRDGDIAEIIAHVDVALEAHGLCCRIDQAKCEQEFWKDHYEKARPKAPESTEAENMKLTLLAARGNADEIRRYAEGLYELGYIAACQEDPDGWRIRAEQAEAALADYQALMKKCGETDQAEFNRKWNEQRERAEKAEAELEDTKGFYKDLKALYDAQNDHFWLTSLKLQKAEELLAHDRKAPTDLSHRLRETADQQPGWKPLLTAAADEIERYYGGMMNWKATAEQKDQQINEVHARGYADAIEMAARLAVQWGDARKDNNGGHALRNYAQALRDGVRPHEQARFVKPSEGTLEAMRKQMTDGTGIPQTSCMNFLGGDLNCPICAGTGTAFGKRCECVKGGA